MPHRAPGVPELTIVRWQARFAADFDRLNRWWLERWFTVEALDEAYLSDPQGRIIDRGGEIFFALDRTSVIGCCAAIAHGADRIELAKLGVAEGAHGRGAGQQLCEAVLAFAAAREARCFLVTSSTLAPARRLYARLGFVVLPFPFPRPYEESDIYMEFRSAR